MRNLVVAGSLAVVGNLVVVEEDLGRLVVEDSQVVVGKLLVVERNLECPEQILEHLHDVRHDVHHGEVVGDEGRSDVTRSNLHDALLHDGKPYHTQCSK